ncbi:MAG: hypothetical protein R3Y24_08390 [Eubacteriales bacterium]
MYKSILPFYMSYPLPFGYSEENKLLSDMEYLQQMYPTEAKKYQRVIVPYLDQRDYPGSVIYDEYPDALSLYKMTKEILREIIKGFSGEEQKELEKNKEKVQEIVHILLFCEILKRRHINPSGRIWF